MTECKIIVVDDNAAVLKTLQRILKSEFGQIIAISKPDMLPAMLRTGDVDVVLLDMNFSAGHESGKEGLFWLNKILGLPVYPSVVVMTAFADIDLAVSSFKNGAVDFIVKPWENDKLITTIRQAVANKKARELNSGSDSEQTVSLSESADKYMRVHNIVLPSHLTLEDMEKELIGFVLKKHDRNIATCADVLEVSRQTLYNKIKKYNL